jgi:hypothetical protein
MSEETEAKPAELTLDDTTGMFSLQRKSSIATTYTVDITITTSDGDVRND